MTRLDEKSTLAPVPISQVTIDDAFWSPKRRLWRDVTIPDCFTKFENDRGGALNNFDLVRDGETGRHAGPPWYDGLIYEMIRGCADFLAAERDTALEARLDGYIARILSSRTRAGASLGSCSTNSLRKASLDALARLYRFAFRDTPISATTWTRFWSGRYAAW